MLGKACLFALLIVYVHGIELKLSTGSIRGKTVRLGNQNLHMFKKLPFAKPPIDDLRFRKPQPVLKWAGTLDATEYGSSCMINVTQSDHPIIRSEDCLYLNVFTSDICLHTKKCPVFVMVHGGAFIFGNAVQYNDTQILDKFVQHEIVFILPAYRVGLFGFLDLGEDYEDAPYNVGLYDLIAGLNWTQHEISNLGGDPKRVTLMGYSSGASAIQYLMSSPQLQDHRLFSQAMLSSGLPATTPSLNRKITEEFLKVTECAHDSDSNDTLTIEQKLKCLRAKSADELNLKTGLIKKWWGHIGPQPSKTLLPARSYMAMAEKRTPIPLLIITARDEMGTMYEPDDTVEHICEENLRIFDYVQNATIRACAKRYNETYPQVRDTYHSIAVRECQVNNQVRVAENGWSRVQFAKNMKPGAQDAKNFREVKSEAVVESVVKQARNLHEVKVGGIAKSAVETRMKSAKNINTLGLQLATEGIKVEGVTKNVAKEAYNINEVVGIKSEAPTKNLTKYAYTMDELKDMAAQTVNESDVRTVGPVTNLFKVGGIVQSSTKVSKTQSTVEEARNAKEGENVRVEKPIRNIKKWTPKAKSGEEVDVHGVESNETAQVNSNHPCYLGIFSQINHTKHADDILFMVGQHLIRIGEFTANDKLMDKFYPNLVRNFIHGRPPTEDWLPTNAYGENYYLLNFDVKSDNFTEQVWPHLVANETYDSKTVDFYLKYLNIVENNASQFYPKRQNSLGFGRDFLVLPAVVDETEKKALKDKEHMEEINEYQHLYGYTSLWTICLFTILLLICGYLFQAKRRRPNDASWNVEPPVALLTEKTRLLS